MFYGMHKPSFSVAFEDYLALAQQPTVLHDKAETVATFLRTTPEQTTEFLATVVKIRERHDRLFPIAADRGPLGFGDITMAFELGAISKRVYHGLLDYVSPLNLLDPPAAALAKLKWKAAPGIGESARQELAKIYKGIRVPNASLGVNEDDFPLLQEDLAPAQKEMTRVLEDAGLKETVIIALFSAAGSSVTEAQYTAATRLLDGHVSKTLMKALLTPPSP